MASLAEAVFPLIRTRADLHHRTAANAHGHQMHEGVDILASAIPTTDPSEVYAVAHRALASAMTVIARADDSSGIVGDACRRLLDMHPRVAADARVPARRLVDWMMTFQVEGVVDYFQLDPVAYAPALGTAGIADYRARLEQLRAGLGPEGAPDGPSPDRHARWVLDRNDRRLAVLDRDVEAIVRTHARDRTLAAWFVDTAAAFEEIGADDLAIRWARDGMDVGPQHQSLRAAELWCRLLGKRHPEEVRSARLFVFRRWPSSSTAARLHDADGATWPDHREEVLATLESVPRDAVLFALLTLADTHLAWNLAHALEMDDDPAWQELIKAYQQVDPLAVLPVHARLVEKDLVEADARRYRLAARRLATMRKLAAGSDLAAQVDNLISQHRRTHSRRPRLQQEFDRAGLP